MATLVLSALGTAIGGPIGGAIGTFLGSQIDAELFGPPDREGPRLAELAVTTSSYGTAIPRHFGAMRAAGSIIWATELTESSEKVGGGKGQPSTVTFSYAANFAVAVASRPIQSIGRIWADGNLLRGAAGDLKVPGALRIYSGHGDQAPDPLLASAEGAACPAYRGLAYCVFEGLQLADFGNRIPALTFEIIADPGTVTLQDVLEPIRVPLRTSGQLAGLAGFSDTGGSLLSAIEVIDRVYPFTCVAGGTTLDLVAEDAASPPVATLPEAVVDLSQESFGSAAGKAARRLTDTGRIPAGLRYYDVGRDYQAGLQRAGGRAVPGPNRIIEFPGALAAPTARQLAEGAARRESAIRETLQWRVAELDPELVPGAIVRVPGRGGTWRVTSWEWRESGIELELVRQSHGTVPALATDTGRSLPPVDVMATPTILQAYELPWDGTGLADEAQIYAAASSQTAGWTGAALYVDIDGALLSLGGSGSRRSILGSTLAPLPGGSAHLFDRTAAIEVELVSEDFALASQTLESLALGANRALIGSEIIQFAAAENLGSGRWRLTGLLRGRGGTEAQATQTIAAGTGFVLLDDRPIRLEPGAVAEAQAVAAIGLADSGAVVAPIAARGITRRPLAPVHPRIATTADGGMDLCWTRRARGAWSWSGSVEPPLVEQAELYEVGVGDPARPDLSWQVASARLLLGADTVSQLSSQHSGQPLWVRQIGTHDRSPLLHLIAIPQETTP